MGALQALARAVGWLAVAAAVAFSLRTAYQIRLFAIQTYGPVIHEFDPWFNYRATEYLAEHGWHRFFTWFDHKVWHPLGRPVATTIYPGMQLAAVAIWRGLDAAGMTWSLNDVCCYMPAWFGVSATLFTGLMAHEGMHMTSGGSGTTLAAASAIMAIIPAHAQRSVGGLFDNESVAMTAMCATFYFWIRSLRTSGSWPIAIVAGVAYAGMAASWGGFVFVINVIGVHAGLLLLLGYDLAKLHRCYSIFFVVGIVGAMQVPIVGWTPLRSLEQLGPLAVLGLLNSMMLYRVARRRMHPGVVYLVFAVVVAAVAALIPEGHFAPLSGRVGALLGASATKTGNPLIDSVSEHRPSSASAYATYLHHAGYTALLGPVVLLWRRSWPSEAAVFLLVLGMLSQIFSLRMSRLMLLMAPATSALAGAAVGFACDAVCAPLWEALEVSDGKPPAHPVRRLYTSWLGRLLRIGVAAAATSAGWPYAREFYETSFHTVQWSLSHPQIVTKTSDGKINDELREAYWWLRDNTPSDARIMAWWDYGYQITGIANRTTLADGNTWNMDHIGLLGMALSAPVPEGHQIARHLADYVLVWKQDQGKSTHMAKIANNVFPGHCEEAKCDQYGVTIRGTPTKMMKESLIWNLLKEASGAFSNLYEPVHKSRYGRVTIAKILNVSQDSKKWSADIGNRVCDAPGSWYCPGQYPPLLRQLMGWALSEGNAEAELHRRNYEQRIAEQRAGAPGPNSPGIPEGSYLDSCSGCRLEGGGAELVCARCSSPGHASSESRLAIRTCASAAADNMQGQLHCHPEANAPDIPAGGFAQSCLGCKVEESPDGGVLKCSDCSTSSGGRQKASILLSRCPAPFKLDNQNGNLVCIGIPNARDIPVGGYRESCQGCQLVDDGARLYCSHCMTSARQQTEVSFSMSQCPRPGRLDNSDGRLVCIGLPHAGDVPEGGYKASCHGCRVEGGVLRCIGCRRADGKMREATLELKRCMSPGRPDNRDGTLVCATS